VKSATLNIRISPETKGLLERLRVDFGGPRHGIKPMSQSDLVTLALAHLANEWGVGVPSE
jgi:hypothetical protein